jgi:hypothetical protein
VRNLIDERIQAWLSEQVIQPSALPAHTAA